LLHNEITNDYNKRLQINNYIGMTDISGCFDRIVPSVVSMLNIKNGCPTSAVEMHADTLQKAKYFLKTKLGISSDYYTITAATPVFMAKARATLQVNGANRARCSRRRIRIHVIPPGPCRANPGQGPQWNHKSNPSTAIRQIPKTSRGNEKPNREPTGRNPMTPNKKQSAGDTDQHTHFVN
jgi:hypothetical protein